MGRVDGHAGADCRRCRRFLRSAARKVFEALENQRMVAHDEVASLGDGLANNFLGGVEANQHACHLAIAVGESDLQAAVVPFFL